MNNGCGCGCGGGGAGGGDHSSPAWRQVGSSWPGGGAGERAPTGQPDRAPAAEPCGCSGRALSTRGTWRDHWWIWLVGALLAWKLLSKGGA